MEDEFAKQVALGYTRPLPPGAPLAGRWLSPMGSVVKKSDLSRCFVLTQIRIVDQSSLHAANAALRAINEKEVKVRISTDLTASGVNGACVTPHFSHSSIHTSLELVTPGCGLAVGDLTRWFQQFKFSAHARRFFDVTLSGVRYENSSLPLGFGQAPYIRRA